VQAGTLEPETGSANLGGYFEAAFAPDGRLVAAVPVLRGGGQWLDFRVAS
jgi:hypothetical protein